MTEYIKRDDVIQRLHRIDDEGNDDKINALALAVYAVQIAPTVEAVNVVRCKDCVFWLKNCYDKPLCTCVDRVTYSNDYCSYGERRDDECK